MSGRSAVIVPETGEPRPSNLTVRGILTYESREGLRLGKESLEGEMQNTQEFWDIMYTKQKRIANAAEKHAGESLSSIAHHIDVQWMYCAYEWTRRDGAAGIDGVTAAEYEVGLWQKL